MIIARLEECPYLEEEARQLHREEWGNEWNDSDVTFICTNRGDLVGTAQFSASDLPSHSHLTPWLASVYVKDFYRGRGVAHLMVNYVERYAKAKGVTTLYLFTHNAVPLYQKLGWEEFDKSEYKGDPVTVMRKILNEDI